VLPDACVAVLVNCVIDVLDAAAVPDQGPRRVVQAADGGFGPTCEGKPGQCEAAWQNR